MNNLITTVHQQISQNLHKRTIKFTHNDKTYWIKRPELGEANIWHKALLLLSKMFKNPLFIPTVVTDPKKSLANEAKKLSMLSQNNIPVPELVITDDDFLVLADSGEPLSVILNSPDVDFEGKKQITLAMSHSLAQMHNSGFYHSRPALRDMTYLDGVVYFLDFEEDLEGILSSDKAIMRDGLIFIHSIYRKLYDDTLADIAIKVYIATLDKKHKTALFNSVKNFGFLYYLLKISYRFLGKDAIAIYKTLEFLRSGS